MEIDVLVAEIGSTTTIVNAFNLFGVPLEFIGRGISRTTVESDVTIGLNDAIKDLKNNLNIDKLTYKEMHATSSAAGGLKITVHGLVYDMTAKAAKEAALNAGANIHLITANLIDDDHMDQIKKVKPNIIIIAGGTNYGEKEVSFQNLLKVKDLNIPIIYSGNIANHNRIKDLDIKDLTIVENVYPRVDDFNILPLRAAIYETFEKHIIKAKGMNKIYDMITSHIVPTPGAVMETTLILNELKPGVLTIDVGGATTDIHSVCEPRTIYQKYHDGEPLFKRTVEGDLGVYINRELVFNQSNKKEIYNQLNLDEEDILKLLKNEPFIPQTKEGKILIDMLSETCVSKALDRHVGDLRRVYTTNGMKVIPDGKDLSEVKNIYLTGGACLNHLSIENKIGEYLENQVHKLIPNKNTPIHKDSLYIFASLGVLSLSYKEKVKAYLKETYIKGVE
ncbi:glutamate mutase L [Mariniplasma anaerobium]|uniref:Ornithine aminomutase n=1 Tax=Mariniplasma anaerobium TaxID=2735436 RepID=A0A7U9TKR4_9MOLU|nr:glutamate mutase L [Mariniplasma anaerobium]BCR35968.1 ornithine aminomutase [Mariniplasma anaerobium]